MELIRKVKFGLNRLQSEIAGETDYWHPRLRALRKEELSDKIYYLDMLPKGFYDGEIRHGVPVLYLNGKYPVFFYITIINYGLGLLHRKNRCENVDAEIVDVLNFIINTQQTSGGWEYSFPEGAVHKMSGKISGMTQGLAISFIIRCFNCGLIEESLCLERVTNAKEVMLSDMCVSKHGDFSLIEEFFVPGTSVLNGSLFALLGLFDYCKFISNMSEFEKYYNDLKNVISRFDFYKWSYYDLEGAICSGFYHQLHIDLLNSFYFITDDTIFKNLAGRWTEGQRFSLLFLLLKAVQKFMRIKNMTMSYSKKAF